MGERGWEEGEVVMGMLLGEPAHDGCTRGSGELFISCSFCSLVTYWSCLYYSCLDGHFRIYKLSHFTPSLQSAYEGFEAENRGSLSTPG